MRCVLKMLLMVGLLALPTASLAGPRGELVIGLQDDPDTLDPALNWSFVGRHVLQSLCDKLVDIDTEGRIVPMLAKSWRFSDEGRTLTLALHDGLSFHDGTPLDAEAVRYNINRSLAVKGTRRKAEIDVVDTVDVIDVTTVAIKLKRPSVSVLAALSDRTGMMVSPAAAEAAGEAFFMKPVCAGPYMFVEHKPQDRIVLQRFAGHWRAGAYHFDRIVYRAMQDTNVRLVNLRSGQLHLIERLAPTDVTDVRRDASLAVFEAPTLGYFGITYNIGNGEGAKLPTAKSKLVRQAIDSAIDRDAINKVVFDGQFEAGNQPFPPSNPYYVAQFPVPSRDVAKARDKLKQAGFENVKLELSVPGDPQRQQVAELLQSMLAEVGITLTIQRVEMMSLLARAKDGNFQATLLGWSGRVDPDLNITPLLGCGAGGNDGRYCNPKLDAALEAARSVEAPAERKAHYAAAMAILLDELPISYLYHGRWIYGARADLKGLRGYPDGIMRLDGVQRLN